MERREGYEGLAWSLRALSLFFSRKELTLGGLSRCGWGERVGREGVEEATECAPPQASERAGEGRRARVGLVTRLEWRALHWNSSFAPALTT